VDRLTTAGAEAGASLAGYDHAAALRRVERAYRDFLDGYIPRARVRAGTVQPPGTPDAGSAQAGLLTGLELMLRMLAPFLPFGTEEVWSWWHDDSIHQAPWPGADRDHHHRP
jgi:valyl-tRNA synthetase